MSHVRNRREIGNFLHLFALQDYRGREFIGRCITLCGIMKYMDVLMSVTLAVGKRETWKTCGGMRSIIEYLRGCFIGLEAYVCVWWKTEKIN